MAIDITRNKNSLQKLDDISLKGVEEMNSKVIKDIPLNLIDPNPDNARIFTMTDINGLASSIESTGFVGAIDVYQMDDGRYQILSGHRRYEAVKQLGWDTIPCIVSTLESPDVVMKKLIESNINTRVLSPLELARSLEYYEKALREESFQGSINKELSRIFGISKSKVDGLKSILKMSKSFQQMAESPDFPIAAFMKAYSFPRDKQERLIELIKQHIDSFEEEEGESGEEGDGFKNPVLNAALVNRYVDLINEEIKKEKRDQEEQAFVEKAQEYVDSGKIEKSPDADSWNTAAPSCDGVEEEKVNADDDVPSVPLPKFPKGSDNLDIDELSLYENYKEAVSEVNDFVPNFAEPIDRKVSAHIQYISDIVQNPRATVEDKEALLARIDELKELIENM